MSHRNEEKQYEKLVTVVIIFCLLLSNNMVDCIVSAEEDYGLEDYLMEEAKQNTTNIDSDVEAQLNEQGVLDDEITQISYDVIEAIEDGDCYGVSVDYLCETQQGMEWLQNIHYP